MPVSARRSRLTVLALLSTALVVPAAPAAHAAGPVLTRVAPTAVVPGHGVTLSGTGLAGTTDVVFLGGDGAADDRPATAFHVVSATSVIAQVPAGAVSGPVRVAAAAGVVTSAVVSVLTAPAVQAVEPASARGGDVVTLRGAFPARSVVAVAGLAATVLPPVVGVDPTTTLRVRLPAAAPGGRTRLVVTSPGGAAGTALHIAPTLRSITPRTGSTTGGGVALLAGSGLTGVSQVTVGGRPVTDLLAVSDKEVAVRLPAGVSGPADVVLRTTSGDVQAGATLVGGWTGAPVPTVRSVRPDWNAVSTATTDRSTPVTVEGDELSATTAVLLGTTRVPAERVQVVAGALTFVPPRTTTAGTASLSLVNTSATGVALKASVPFTFAAAPTVTRLVPATGAAGTPVIVLGTSFVGEPSVTFGGQSAACTRTSSTSLRCLAPDGSGTAAVVVRTPLGSSEPAAPQVPPVFTHVAGPAVPPVAPVRPTVRALLPAAGVAGSTVELSGALLQEVSAVEFTGVAPDAWVPAARPLVVGPTRLLVRVPAGAATGPLRVTGRDDVPVVAPVRYVAARRPSVTSVDAVGDATVGVVPGDLLVVHGTGLVAGTARSLVTVGGIAAPVLTQPAPTDTALAVRVPRTSGGRVPVVVTTPLGVAPAPDALFLLPQVRSRTPVTAVRTGGVAVTVTGTALTGTTGVTFGGVPARSVVVLSDTSLLAVTGPGSASSDPVVVTTRRDGQTGSSSGQVVDLEQVTPTLTAASPASSLLGAGPVPVTLTGTALQDTTVVFGRDPGTVLEVAPDGTSMVVVPPERDAPGLVQVTATTRGHDPVTGTLPGGFRYVLPVPTVSALSATTAPAGRTPPPLTLTGTHLRVDQSVVIGTQEAVVLSAAPDGTSLVVQPPRRDSAGAVPVTVTDRSFDPPLTGTSGTPLSYVLPVPTVTGMDVTSTLAGRSPAAVTLTGTHLTEAVVVRFGAAEAQVLSAADDGTSAVVVPPRRDASGDVQVTVTDETFAPPLTGVLRTPFRYVAPVPVVTSLSAPTTLAGRTPLPLTVSGSYLTDDAQVRFGTALAEVLSASEDGTALVVVPPRRDVPGDVPVTVTVPSFDPPLTGRLAGAFRYLAPTPTAASLSAVTAYAGRTPAPVTVLGTHLSPAVSVLFGGAPGTVLSAAADGTSLVVRPPRRDSAGPVPVTLVDPGFDPPLTSTLTTPFTYVFPVPVLAAISSGSAVAGAPPAQVVLTGSLLTTATVVRFGGEPAQVVSAAADGTSLTVVPPLRSSPARVLVTAADEGFDPPLTGTLPTTFRYLPVPTLTGLSPDGSDVGTVPAEVTLTGRNLRLDTLVTLGGTAATVRSAAADGTSLVVVPPARTTPGLATVTVTNTDGGTWTASLPDAYAYRLAAATVTGLTVGTTTASTGPGGSTVTVRGSSFLGVTSVAFGTVSAPFTVVDATTLVTTAPVTPAGRHGTTDAITVTNGTGRASTGAPAAAAVWTWDSRPVVTALSAGTGAQGSTVTVTGTGLSGTTAVRWGSIDAVSFAVVDDTRLTAVVPVSPLGGTGVADVTVTARGLPAAAPPTPTADDWTWTPIAAITGVTTPGAAGDTVTVTGRDFTGTRSVTVGGTAVTPTVVSATTLTFVAPRCPSNQADTYTDKPVVVVNGSGAPSTPTTARANLFTWRNCPIF